MKDDYYDIIADPAYAEEYRLKERIRELESHLDQTQRSLNFFLCMVNESEGIAGWHLNGDIAPWSDWQDEIDAAFAAAGEPPR